jgi:hypothetical protein
VEHIVQGRLIKERSDAFINSTVQKLNARICTVYTYILGNITKQNKFLLQFIFSITYMKCGRKFPEGLQVFQN